MNELEREWHAALLIAYPKASVRPQAKGYRLANGVVYWPDFTAIVDGTETAWEVKGRRAWDDAVVKLKVAASAWPEVRWLLVWKEEGQWKQQEILP